MSSVNVKTIVRHDGFITSSSKKIVVGVGFRVYYTWKRKGITHTKKKKRASE